ncbi:flagellar hook-associated protein FlgL [Pluralibacter gergoviae]
MRVSTLMMYQQTMGGITQSQSLWLDYGEQMSTGLRVRSPSDDPIAASQAVVLSQAQAQNDQFTTARTFAQQRISQEESSLGQVTSAIQSAQEKIVYAGNGTLSDDDRASLAADLQGLRDQIYNLANGQDGNGRYIFGGYSSDKAPFSASGEYTGGASNVEQQVDSARTMVVGHAGSAVFDAISGNGVKEPDGSASETNLFHMLDSAIAALKVPVAGDSAAQATSGAAIDKTNRGLRNALNNVLTVRAEAGSQLKELDALNAQGGDRGLSQDRQMSALVNVDWNSTISNYYMQQAALKASYKAFSDMQGMSLFQLNK